MAAFDLAYFALVMATGIVSVGVGYHGAGVLSAALLGITIAAYAVLVALTGWRVIARRSGLWAELTDPRRAFGSFTFVAGTDVLATRLAAAGRDRIALGLLAVGCLGWLPLGYLVPAAVLRNRAGRTGPIGADGTWFLWTVAVQSVAVVAATLERTSPGLRSGLALVAIVSWSVGVFLYALTGVLVGVRLLFRPPRPEDLTPPYWVAMGATAITALAGARLAGMTHAPAAGAVQGAAAVSVMFWAFGTWLIPALAAAEWWRHVTHRIAPRYDPSLWSIVFPLGMYGVAAHDLGRAERFPLMSLIGDGETWVALTVWALTFAAMLAHLARHRPVAPGGWSRRSRPAGAVGRGVTSKKRRPPR